MTATECFTRRIVNSFRTCAANHRIATSHAARRAMGAGARRRRFEVASEHKTPAAAEGRVACDTNASESVEGKNALAPRRYGRVSRLNFHLEVARTSY